MGKVADFMKGIIDGITSKRIVFGFGVLSFALFVVLVLIVFSDGAAEWVKNLLGIKKDKIQAIQLLGWAISGTFVAIGLAVLSQRTDAQMCAAKAQVDAAKAQADAIKTQVENNRLVEKGHTQERFKTATEHLGHDKSSVRISAYYEFLHLIKDNGEEFRKSILNILYAHIRATTYDFANRKDVKNAREVNFSIKPTEEIQGLLDVLFKSHGIYRDDAKLDLQRVCFSGVDLVGAKLLSVDFSNADLFHANLDNADLSDANLYKANLSGASLWSANLGNAWAVEANLSGANLSGALLPEANLRLANLSKVDAWGARLSEVDFEMADLSQANLRMANLSGAYFVYADMSKAQLG